jgi:hypothetical protein
MAGDDPIPGAYELHLPADNVTIWYRVTPMRARRSKAGKWSEWYTTAIPQAEQAYAEHLQHEEEKK